MKVALYARVSMDESNLNDRRYQEPENQLEPLRAFCQTAGYEISEEYIDRGSGADPKRPSFRKMIADAHFGKFKLIIVWRLDRFSRERMMNVNSYLMELKRCGVGVKSLTESWADTSQDNPFGDLIIAILTWVASEERRKISERTKAGIQRRRNIGQWKGGRPKKGMPPTEPSIIA